MPAIPATQESEAEESLEPGRWRLQWAQILPLHSTLDNKSKTLSQKKKKKERKKERKVRCGKMITCPKSHCGSVIEQRGGVMSSHME